MIYARADIHGQYDKYIATLERINFNENDVLLVLGDVLVHASLDNFYEERSLPDYDSRECCSIDLIIK